MVKIKFNNPIPEYLQPVQYQLADNSLDNILGQKIYLLREKLGMLQNALYERRQIQHDNNKRIDSDLTKCQNQIFALEDTCYFTMQREWEHKRFDLWREYRNEQASAFRDLTNLEREIRDTTIEYIKERQDNQLFGL